MMPAHFVTFSYPFVLGSPCSCRGDRLPRRTRMKAGIAVGTVWSRAVLQRVNLLHTDAHSLAETLQTKKRERVKGLDESR